MVAELSLSLVRATCACVSVTIRKADQMYPIRRVVLKGRCKRSVRREAVQWSRVRSFPLRIVGDWIGMRWKKAQEPWKEDVGRLDG
jgi:hypothetical protein